MRDGAAAQMHARIQDVPAPASPAPRVWTPLDLIKWTTGYFQKKGIASPRLEAELLLADVLDCPRIRLYVDFEKAVPQEKLAQYRDYVRRRGENREPLAYIVGHAQFLDLRLKVGPAVLIPRPETEILALWAVERAKEFALERSGDVRVADMCTGSGCLALYIAAKEPRAAVAAADISASALAVAEENARALKLEGRVTFRQGDLFGALPPEEKGTFDLLVANPPYVDPAARETLQAEVRDHEPAEALYAQGGALSIVGRILAEAPAWLKPGGWLGMELGLNQTDGVRRLAQESGGYDSIEITADDAKLPRYLHARRV